MAAKKKGQRRRNEAGRFISKAEAERLDKQEARSAAARKGWQTRRAIAQLETEGLTKRKATQRAQTLKAREINKLARKHVKAKRKAVAPAPTPVAPPPKPKGVWYLRTATPQAKALESRRAREALESIGYDREQARELVKEMTRKTKAQVVRTSGQSVEPPRKRKPKKKAPKRKVKVKESREAARNIAAAKRAARKATTKEEKEKWERALRKVEPKKRTKKQAEKERTLRQERQALADELAQAGLNIPGAPTKKRRLSFAERTNAQVWEERALRYLEKMGRGFEGASVAGFVNPDGTVDTELIVPIPKGQSARQVSTRLSAQSSGVPRGSWMAGSILFQLRDIEDPEAWKYMEYLGLSTITSYPVNMNKQRPAAVFTAVNQFSQNQADSGKLKPSKVVVRLHKGKAQPRYYVGDIEE